MLASSDTYIPENKLEVITGGVLQRAIESTAWSTALSRILPHVHSRPRHCFAETATVRIA